VIRIAACADVHFGEDSAGTLRPHVEEVSERADVLLIGGDLTRAGRQEEAAVLAQELSGISVPVVTVLGNHDFHHDEQDLVRKLLEDAGVIVLEGASTEIQVNGTRLAVAGAKGFGGGFAGACATEFGEPEMKAFVGHTKRVAGELEDAITSMRGDVRVVLLHYAPIKGTLMGEKLEIYPFLGSYLLGEAIDRAGADLVLHGHAHAGSEKGVTPGGIHVRNVAMPVIKHAFNFYCFGASGLED
jgi:Icc-related predicted phosphoesterase